MVYDPEIKAILLFGGRLGRENLNDFWKFDGAWTQINPEPSVRFAPLGAPYTQMQRPPNR